MAIHVNNKAVLLGLIGVAGIIAIYFYYPSKDKDIKSALQKNAEPIENKGGLLQKLTNNQFKDLPSNQIKDSPVKSDTMSWDDEKGAAGGNMMIKSSEEFVQVMGVNVFRREVVSGKGTPSGTFLFLHGMKYSSQTWWDLGTLSVAANKGYRAIAVDLPGYGKSNKSKDVDPVEFMMVLLKTLGLDNDKPIIVSPSMSGGYALPLLFQQPEVFKGYVPVAPVGVKKFKDQYKSNKVATCSIVGDQDTSMGAPATALFGEMPNGETHTLKEAGHACYLDQPAEFHRIMFDFAKKTFGA